MKLRQRIAGSRCGTTVPGAKTKQETTRENDLGRIGKDRETCPCRNNTVNNEPDSFVNAWNISDIQHFYYVFQFAG